MYVYLRRQDTGRTPCTYIYVPHDQSIIDAPNHSLHGIYRKSIPYRFRLTLAACCTARAAPLPSRATMTSSGSSSYNPFAGPDPADIRHINIHDRVPFVLDATGATYFAWKTYFSLLFRENNLVDHVDGSVNSRVMVGDSEWTAVDATLIRWFFTTISKDLFHTVVSVGQAQ